MTQTQTWTHTEVTTESLLDVVLRATEQPVATALSGAPVDMPFEFTRARLVFEIEALRRIGEKGRALQSRANDLARGLTSVPVRGILCPVCGDPKCSWSFYLRG